MKRLAGLARLLESASGHSEKEAGLGRFFSEVSGADRDATLFFLLKGKRKAATTLAALRMHALASSACPEWLYQRSLEVTRDDAETIALLVNGGGGGARRGIAEWLAAIDSWRGCGQDEFLDHLREAWGGLDPDECFIFNKVLLGTFRLTADPGLVARALARISGVDAARIAARMSAPEWRSCAGLFEALTGPAAVWTDRLCPHRTQPYSEIRSFEELSGPLDEWFLEWLEHGERLQVVVRPGAFRLWESDGRPAGRPAPAQVEAAFAALPAHTVLEGWLRGGAGDSTFVVSDLLELAGEDLRSESFRRRREALERFFFGAGRRYLQPSERLHCPGPQALPELRAEARRIGACGLAFCRLSSTSFESDPPSRLAWRSDPFVVRGVLLYADTGGSFDGVFQEFTFGVWEGERLIPFAKAGQGLSESELEDLSKFVRENQVERFGPVRRVQPKLVYEIAFDGMEVSKRTKCGFRLLNARVLKPAGCEVEAAHRLSELRACYVVR